MRAKHKSTFVTLPFRMGAVSSVEVAVWIFRCGMRLLANIVLGGTQKRSNVDTDPRVLVLSLLRLSAMVFGIEVKTSSSGNCLMHTLLNTIFFAIYFNATLTCMRRDASISQEETHGPKPIPRSHYLSGLTLYHRLF